MMKTTLCKYTYISLVIALFFVLFTPVAHAQRRVKLYEDYISQYNRIATEHMDKYGIPASITLAQGILESGAGVGELAVKSNNHFGIKCHNSWSGPRIYHDDDRLNDCFRKYERVEDSYKDHSEFLTKGIRYKELFNLPKNDFRAWARGLQKSGYATDVAYANKLIKIIEDYELFRFDDSNYEANARATAQPKTSSDRHTPYRTHGLVYVIANANDSYSAIAQEFGFREKDLLKYNEVPENFPLSEGDIVYFQKKKPRADEPYFDHVVQIGESMYSISQRYGIQVKSLYKLNKKDFEYVPTEGDVLQLR